MFTRIAMALGTALVATAAIASPAAADHSNAKSGHCDNQEFCLFYYDSYSNYGSVIDFGHSDADLWNDRFISPYAGQGQIVANNSEAYRNHHYTLTADVFTGRNYTGSRGYIPPRRVGNFSTTYKNNVESWHWR
jgi:hypothetical protein